MLTTSGLSAIIQLKGSTTAMSLTCPLFDPNWSIFFCQNSIWNEKIQVSSERWKKIKNFSSSLTKYSSISGSRWRNFAFLSRTAHFWITCLSLQAIPCLIMSPTKNGDRGGMRLLRKISLFCEISLVRQLFPQNFARHSAPCPKLCKIF